MTKLFLVNPSAPGSNFQVWLEGGNSAADFTPTALVVQAPWLNARIPVKGGQNIPLGVLQHIPPTSTDWMFLDFGNFGAWQGIVLQADAASAAAASFDLGGIPLASAAVSASASASFVVAFRPANSDYSAEAPFLCVTATANFTIATPVSGAATDSIGFELVIETPGSLLPDRIALPTFRICLPNFGFPGFKLSTPVVPTWPASPIPFSIPTIQLPGLLSVAIAEPQVVFTANASGGSMRVEATSISITPAGGTPLVISHPAILLTLNAKTLTVTVSADNAPFAVNIPAGVIGNDILTFSWQASTVVAALNGGVLTITLTVPKFRFDSQVAGGEYLEGDAVLIWVQGRLDAAHSSGGLNFKGLSQRIAIQLQGFEHRVEQAIVAGVAQAVDQITLAWSQSQAARWLALVTDQIVDESAQLVGAAAAAAGAIGEYVRIKIYRKKGKIDQIRFDWIPQGGQNQMFQRTFHLPGVDLAVTSRPCPATTGTDSYSYTLLLDQVESIGTTKIRLLQTFSSNDSATLYPTFGLTGSVVPEGSDNRYLSDPSSGGSPFITLEATVNTGAGGITLEYVSGGIKGGWRFLTQWAKSLPQQDADGGSVLEPTAAELKVFAKSITASLKFNASGCTLPFLNSPGLNQSLKVTIADNLSLDLTKREAEVAATITAQLGSMALKGAATMTFSLDTLAFGIDSKGLVLSGDNPVTVLDFIPGLQFEFTAVPGGPPYDLLSINVNKGNFEIAECPGSTIRILVTCLSSDPLAFDVSDFSVNSGGIDFTATVNADRPVPLNGIDTLFHFDSGTLRMQQSRIDSVTIQGQGSLPPALVGHADVTAGITLAQKNGTFTVTAAHADLLLQKPFENSGTNFRFSISRLGLEWEGDADAHFYFTLWGFAEFMPGGVDDDHALAFLPGIKIELQGTPLTTDWSKLKNVTFTVSMPTKTFSVFGCFEFELRGIGFLPQADCFGGDPAITITGQIKFALEGGDVVDVHIDFHKLYIGLPKGGHGPRISCTGLGLSISAGDLFKLSGSVDMLNASPVDATGLLASGFAGTGMIEIAGLPQLRASFAFLRVQQPGTGAWLRAWFIYIQANKFSIQLDPLPIFIREIGLGFGYRYTLASIREADAINDVRALIKELNALSRTQGELTNISSWNVDIEDPGQSARWTIVCRAMFSFSSANSNSMSWDKEGEKQLPNVALFDVVTALRSDLTFLMTLRGWLFTNYYHYTDDGIGEHPGLREAPQVSGFMLLSARKRMFLAHMSSNPNGISAGDPAGWEIFTDALKLCQFSASFLAQPGLVQMDLGWPNNLRFSYSLGGGILTVFIGAGILQRIESRRVISAMSLMARGHLDIEAGLSLGFFGVRIYARADVAYGSRIMTMIGVPVKDNCMLYAAMGVSIDAEFGVEAWLRIDLCFCSITINFSFSFRLTFTALVELGVKGFSVPGLRARGTVALSVLGMDLRLGIDVGANKDEVDQVRAAMDEVMQMGLEASDMSFTMPGLPDSQPAAAPAAPAAPAAVAAMAAAPGQAAAKATVAPAAPAAPGAVAPPPPPPYPSNPTLHQPGYTLLRRDPEVDSATGKGDGYTYFIILPNGDQLQGGNSDPHYQTYRYSGFLPPPPVLDDDGQIHSSYPTPTADFIMSIKSAAKQPVIEVEQYRWLPNPKGGDGSYGWEQPVTTGADPSFSWRVNWQAPLGPPKSVLGRAGDPKAPLPNGSAKTPQAMLLSRLLAKAFICDYDFGDSGHLKNPWDLWDESRSGQKLDSITALGDPVFPNSEEDPTTDARVLKPEDSAYEPALLNALGALYRSPHFRYDPTSEYDRGLQQAYAAGSSLYQTIPSDPTAAVPGWHIVFENALHTRGLVIKKLMNEFNAFTSGGAGDRGTIDYTQIPFLAYFGLLFRVKHPDPDDSKLPDWLTSATPTSGAGPYISQRNMPNLPAPSTDPTHTLPVLPFTGKELGFDVVPPRFINVRAFCDAGTISIAWTLDWAPPAALKLQGKQPDVLQHLDYCEVVRIPESDATAAPVKFLVKQAFTLAPRMTNGQLFTQRLAPRFGLNDYFHGEDPSVIANMPNEGLTYFYSITPVDHSGARGPTFTIVATRLPERVPLAVPEAELTVTYDFRKSADKPTAVDLSHFTPLLSSSTTPQAMAPDSIIVDIALAQDPGEWTYNLVFRKEQTLASGNYGLDAAVQNRIDPKNPITFSRIAPGDIVVQLLPNDKVPLSQETTSADSNYLDPEPHGQGWLRYKLKVGDLQGAGVFPPDPDKVWRPESWTAFIRVDNVPKDKESAAGVRILSSGLTPVRLALRTVWYKKDQDPISVSQVKRPAALEWLPANYLMALLPGEDLQQQSGPACVPMPGDGGLLDLVTSPTASPGTLKGCQFFQHPEVPWLVRLRWNPAPSGTAGYPSELNAGFTIHEFDLDAISTRVFDLNQSGPVTDYLQALWPHGRLLQDVLIAPEDEVELVPNNTSKTGEWEAWYPSNVLRSLYPHSPAKTSELPGVPADVWGRSWWSYRESYLQWPDWDYVPNPNLQFSDRTPVPYATPVNVAAIKSDNVNFKNPIAGIDSITIALDAPGAQEATFLWKSTDPHGPAVSYGDQSCTSITIQSGPPLNVSIKKYLESFPPGCLQYLSFGKVDTALMNSQTANVHISYTVVTVGAGASTTSFVGTIGLNPQGTPAAPPLQFPPATGLHPFLQALLETIAAADQNRYTCEVQARQAANSTQPGNINWEGFLTQNAPGADAYGWGVLQRFGLSVAFTIRDKPTAQPLHPVKVQSLLRAALATLLVDPQSVYRQHLHVDYLVQRGHATDLRAGKPLDATGLLALAQVSLRPIPVQRYYYTRLIFSGPRGTTFLIPVNILTSIDAVEVKSRITVLAGTSTTPGFLAVPLGPTGSAEVIYRSPVSYLPADFQAAFQSKLAPPTPPNPQQLQYGPINGSINGPSQYYCGLATQPTPITLLPIKPVEHPGQNYETILPGELSAPTDDAPYYAFSTNADWLHDFCNPASPARHQWCCFKALADLLASDGNDGNPIVPLQPDGVQNAVPGFLNWSARFLQHCGTVGGQLAPADGPWLATAYSRRAAPAFAVTEPDGRLRYDHFLQDSWAHALRYYVWPYSRYDRLWLSLSQEVDAEQLGSDGNLFARILRLHPAAMPNVLDSPELNAKPDPALLRDRSVDVTLPRREKIAPPCILSTRRLNPSRPDSTWEVLLAQHLEQGLSDHNTTLRRRLGFRRVAWTLLRQPAYTQWGNIFAGVVRLGDGSVPAQVQVQYPASIPDGLPTLPDSAAPPQLRYTATDPVTDEALALGRRMRRFDEGALAIQWNGVPYYYLHRFIAVALTSRVASPPSTVIQRDFGYQSPSGLAASIDGASPAPDPTSTVADLADSLVLTFELGCFWDGMANGPQTGQQLWPGEMPSVTVNPAPDDPAGSKKILTCSYSSLPDPDVSYEILLQTGTDFAKQDRFLFQPAPPAPTQAATASPNPLDPAGWTLELENNPPASSGPSSGAPRGTASSILFGDLPKDAAGSDIVPATPAVTFPDGSKDGRFQCTIKAVPQRTIPTPDPSVTLTLYGAPAPGAIAQCFVKHSPDLGLLCDTIATPADVIAAYYPAVVFAAVVPSSAFDEIVGTVFETDFLCLIAQGPLGDLSPPPPSQPTKYVNFLKMLLALALPKPYLRLGEAIHALCSNPNQPVAVRWLPQALKGDAASDFFAYGPLRATLIWTGADLDAKVGKTGGVLAQWAQVELDATHPSASASPFTQAANIILDSLELAKAVSGLSTSASTTAVALNLLFGFDDGATAATTETEKSDYFKSTNNGVSFVFSTRHKSGTKADVLIAKTTASALSPADHAVLTAFWNSLKEQIKAVKAHPLPNAMANWTSGLNDRLVVGTRVLRDPAYSDPSAAGHLQKAQGVIDAYYPTASVLQAIDRTASDRIHNQVSFRDQLEGLYRAEILLTTAPKPADTAIWKSRLVCTPCADLQICWVGKKADAQAQMTDVTDFQTHLAATEQPLSAAIQTLLAQMKAFAASSDPSSRFLAVVIHGATTQPAIPTGSPGHPDLTRSLYYGKFLVTYTGIMDATVAAALKATPGVGAVDLKAMDILYSLSIGRALQNSSLVLHTRRGGADPQSIPVPPAISI